MPDLRATLRGLALVLGLLPASGCATVVLGPGTAESNFDLGISNTLISLRPGDLGFGPHTGPSRSGQDTLARSLEIIVQRVDMADVADRTIYLPGFSGELHPLAPRRAEVAYLATRLAERVIEAGGRIAFSGRDAEFVLIPWIQVSGGITTHREYRSYGYPIYSHEEDQRPAWVTVFLYDKRRKRLDVLEGDRTWHVRIDSYILGIIPIEWFLRF